MRREHTQERPISSKLLCSGLVHASWRRLPPRSRSEHVALEGNSSRDLQVAWSCQSGSGHAEEIISWRNIRKCESMTIEGVQHFQLELKVDALPDRNILNDADVFVVIGVQA